MRIFRPKKDEVKGDWRKLHNEVLYNLYCYIIIISDQIKKDELGWTCSLYR
jgi:hypothetical protein